MRLCALLGLASAALASPPFRHVADRRDQACNGFAQLCDRKYSDVVFVGAHDSAFVGVLPTDNQYESVARQLDQGVRFLQAQSHLKQTTIELCHTSCAERDAGSLTTYLTPIKAFLDAHPDEVVTLLLTNGDAIPVTEFDAVFQAVGLASYAFVPDANGRDAWPTLGEMIAAGTRLVVFMDYHADTAAVDYLLDEFSFIYETPFDTTDAQFAECTVDRPTNGDAATKLMGLVNHYLDVELDVLGQPILIPDAAAAATTNALASITAQMALCVSEHGRAPTFVLLDFISVGDAMAAQQQLNGL